MQKPRCATRRLLSFRRNYEQIFEHCFHRRKPCDFGCSQTSSPRRRAQSRRVARRTVFARIAKKISYLTDCFSVFNDFKGGDLHRFIQDNISGFSGATIEELLLRANINSNVGTFGAIERERLFKTIKDFASVATNTPEIPLCPCIINDKEVYPIEYRSLENSDKSNVKTLESMSDAYDALITDCDKDIRNKARLKSLATIAKHLRQKVEKT